MRDRLNREVGKEKCPEGQGIAILRRYSMTEEQKQKGRVKYKRIESRREKSKKEDRPRKRTGIAGENTSGNISHTGSKVFRENGGKIGRETISIVCQESSKKT